MRRFLCALMAMLVLLLPFKAANGTTSYTSGDIDGDGVASASDAALVLRAADGRITLDNAQSARADATGSLSVNAADATAILLLAAGRILSFSDLTETVTGGLLGDRYLDLFAYRGTVWHGSSYRSAYVSISMRETVFEDAVCYVADVYLQDITSFRTAFASGQYKGQRQDMLEIVQAAKAVLALNGDMYTTHTRGPLVRNGEWYRTNVGTGMDVCVLYQNGVLETYDAGSADIAVIRAGKPYQTWLFGPRLLDENGSRMTSFTCADSIRYAAARSAIGYYEPGHYVLVAVDGKENPASEGLTMSALSRFMESLGCKVAYNLPGGMSSTLVASGAAVTYSKLSRSVSDILCIAEPLPAGSLP